MKTILKNILLSLTLLAGAFTAQAQVKVGSMPTTIAPTSNLEVQATNGKKVIVDKAIGTVQVENLPAGVPANAIVVADAAGVLKQVDPSTFVGSASGSNLSVMSYNLMPYNTIPPVLGGTATERINYDHIDYDPQGAADITTDKFTIKKTGWYALHINATMRADGQAGVSIYKNQPAIPPSDPAYYTYRLTLGTIWGPAGLVTTQDYTRYFQLTAGDQLSTDFGTCGGCGTSAQYSINTVQFSIQYLGL